MYKTISVFYLLTNIHGSIAVLVGWAIFEGVTLSASNVRSNSPLYSEITWPKWQIFDISLCLEQYRDLKFWLAMIDRSRAGRAEMQIGSAREAIIIALLMYKFGEENVRTDIPITKPEVDVIVHNQPISTKTITAKNIGGGVKAVWIVDPQKAGEFVVNYKPKCDIL